MLDRAGLSPAIDRVLFDLGVSSLQLDEPDRGFAYAQDAPLDMRMDQTRGITAEEVVNTYAAAELARVLRVYGEEKFAARIASAIVRERAKARITSSARLAELVRDAIPAPARRTGGHPAKRTFQALRIEVNGELAALEAALPAALDALALGGRMVVLSYHSLEDRIVKRALAAGPAAPGRSTCRSNCPAPGRRCGCSPGARSCPSEAEVAANPRAASVRLRAAERIDPAATQGDRPRTAAAGSRRCTRPSDDARADEGGRRPGTQRTQEGEGHERAQQARRGRGAGPRSSAHRGRAGRTAASAPASDARRPAARRADARREGARVADPGQRRAAAGRAATRSPRRRPRRGCGWRRRRRSRVPRAPFVALVLVLVVGGVLGILLVNTKINENAFRLDELQEQQAALDIAGAAAGAARSPTHEAPGNLAAAARRLGLVEAGDAGLHPAAGRQGRSACRSRRGEAAAAGAATSQPAATRAVARCRREPTTTPRRDATGPGAALRVTSRRRGRRARRRRDRPRPAASAASATPGRTRRAGGPCASGDQRAGRRAPAAPRPVPARRCRS